jgi:hypothetical protein
VWLRPGLVEKLRDEILPLVTFSAENGKRKATLDIRLVEKQCPLLLSCQREGVRVANHMVARRAITADTLLTDEDGTTVPTFCVSFPPFKPFSRPVAIFWACLRSKTLLTPMSYFPSAP